MSLLLNRPWYFPGPVYFKGAAKQHHPWKVKKEINDCGNGPNGLFLCPQIISHE